ncbi:MAG: hypothetical protein WAN12_10890 [Candidatus Acidiferrum sp.]
MRLYTYIVHFDGGFAPCVSRSICTLACCKPRIRATAKYSDWVAGTTPKEHDSGQLIYLMRVERAFTFAEYYRDETLRSRIDNIYRPKADSGYAQQRNNFHGPDSIRKDLCVDRVLVSNKFVYFGEKAPFIPEDFLEFVPRGRGHRVFGNSLGEPDDRLANKKIKSFVRWAFSGGAGKKGRPFDQPCRHHSCST